jgi:hypothetical protein
VIKKLLRATLLFLPLLSVLARTGSAQALPAGKGPGAYTTIGVSGALFQSDYGKYHLWGPSVYADIHLHRHAGITAEARFLNNGGKFGVREQTYLAGPRWAFKPVGWVPYVKFPVGLGRVNFPYTYGYGKYFVMAPGGGLERWMAGDRIHVRVIDVEYQFWPQFTYGTLHPYGVSAGISFQIF